MVQKIFLTISQRHVLTRPLVCSQSCQLELIQITGNCLVSLRSTSTPPPFSTREPVSTPEQISSAKKTLDSYLTKHSTQTNSTPPLNTPSATFFFLKPLVNTTTKQKRSPSSRDWFILREDVKLFADWLFSESGIPSVQVLALGCFSRRGKGAAPAVLCRRERDGDVNGELLPYKVFEPLTEEVGSRVKRIVEERAAFLEAGLVTDEELETERQR